MRLPLKGATTRSVTRLLSPSAAHFQCLSDNPWAESGGMLAAADPTAFVVLMRAKSPPNYAITWALFRIPKSTSFDETVRQAAERHIESRMQRTPTASLKRVVCSGHASASLSFA